MLVILRPLLTPNGRCVRTFVEPARTQHGRRQPFHLSVGTPCRVPAVGRVGDSKMHLIRDFVSVRHCLRRRALRRERITVRAGANISFGGPGGLPGEPYGQAPDNNILHGLSSSSSTSSIRNDIPSFANEAMRGSPWNRLAARLVRHTTLAFPLLVSAE